jgi:bifunctional DNase/RNase
MVGVRVELPSKQPIILLKEDGGERYLPIWIGAVEATAMAFALEGIATARPMTHDLMRDLLHAVQVDIARVEIRELHDGVFESTMLLSNGTEIPARPSDACALAVRMGNAPIYAAAAVLDEAGITDPEGEPS